VLRDTCEHSRAEFVGIVKGEDEVGPAWPRKNLVGTGLTLDLPADAEQQRAHVVRACSANRSCRDERDAEVLTTRFPMLQTVGNYAKGKGLNLGNGLVF